MAEINHDWFEVRRLPHAVTMIREPHQWDDVKSYLIEGRKDVAIIDTGTGAGDFAALVASVSPLRPRVLQSHAHWDHIGASHHFRDVAVHPAEADVLRGGYPADLYTKRFASKAADPRRLPAGFTTEHGLPGCEPTSFLAHGDRIDLGDRVLEVFHTPGHSPGGLTFLDRQARILFVGDLLYLGQMFLFFPTSNPAEFRNSLQLVTSLLDDVDTIYPAHGPVPITRDDARTIRDAFELVWKGRAPDRFGSTYDHLIAIHDFGRFSFLMGR